MSWAPSQTSASQKTSGAGPNHEACRPPVFERWPFVAPFCSQILLLQTAGSKPFCFRGVDALEGAMLSTLPHAARAMLTSHSPECVACQYPLPRASPIRQSVDVISRPARPVDSGCFDATAITCPPTPAESA